MLKDKLIINNFGSIRSSEIDVLKSMIFLGKNSTGKSFTSLLLHSLLNL